LGTTLYINLDYNNFHELQRFKFDIAIFEIQKRSSLMLNLERTETQFN